ncbi:hypothetical protein C2G38_2208270 [Gigaspora rosea]|uniref:Uncharacterized protein n=1 Tax=Gigaspora rosea TaxID=44941 RepID=A0A397UQE9_9GLOM|nr:hypothetical protein C2G38_2208270 [Gigaspora rosea]
MNPKIPEERKYIEELTQEYIYLCEELDYKEKYKVKGKDIYDREEISEIGIEFKNLYTAKRLLKRIKLLYEAIQEEITRKAVQYYLENNEKLTIYNYFKNKRYHFYFLELESFYRFINILQEEEPVGEYERQYIQKEYRSSISFIIRKQIPTANLFDFRPYNYTDSQYYFDKIPIIFLRSITKDYIDLQDSNQENNVVEQILSKKELNIKLQGPLDQIKIQIQTLQGQLTLEEAYKNHEYTFLFKRATAIYKTIYGNKPEIIVQRKYLSQIRKLVEFYIKESNLTEYWFYPKSTGLLLQEYIDIQDQKGKQFSTLYTKEKLIKQFKDLKDQLVKEIKRTAYQFKEETKKELTIFNTFEKKLEELQYQYYRLIKTIITHFIPKSELNEYCYLEFRRKHQRIPTVEELLEGTYNNNKEYELAKTKEKQFRDTHEEEKTRTYYIKKIILLLENYKSEIVKELTTLEKPRLKEYYKTALISISVNQGILEERIKEISTQNIEGEIQHNLINEEQNKTLEELRRFRFNWQPISTPTRTKKTKRYPRNKDILETRELIQITNDIWETINDLINRINPTNNSRLGAILLTLEGAKSIAREFYPHKRLLAESPEFCKIFEDNPETGETEFYYGDYNNQFTILPFRFHHLILHHLEAIDNILYSEGARNKIYLEKEESYESAYSEINKLSQEFIDKTKKVKELRKEKKKLELVTDKIINKILLKNEPELKEEYFKRTGRKIEELGYYTIASDRKETEPEYLEHKELYKKLDYLHSIIINNIEQYLIKRKENYDTVGELNIYNCYSDNHCWNKLNIARNIYKLQKQVYQPYLEHKIGIVAANNLYADIVENIILSIKGDQFHQRIENTIEKAS